MKPIVVNIYEASEREYLNTYKRLEQIFPKYGMSEKMYDDYKECYWEYLGVDYRGVIKHWDHISDFGYEHHSRNIDHVLYDSAEEFLSTPEEEYQDEQPKLDLLFGSDPIEIKFDTDTKPEFLKVSHVDVRVIYDGVEDLPGDCWYDLDHLLSDEVTIRKVEKSEKELTEEKLQTILRDVVIEEDQFNKLVDLIMENK